METVMHFVGLGIIAGGYCWAIFHIAGTKVRYKDNQLQVKKDGKWICYDSEIMQSVSLAKDVLEKLVDRQSDGLLVRMGSLLAKIHANHKPEWEFQKKETVRGQCSGMIVHPWDAITLKCKKCGHIEQFAKDKLPADMKKALTEAGIIG